MELKINGKMCDFRWHLGAVAYGFWDSDPILGVKTPMNIGKNVSTKITAYQHVKLCYFISQYTKLCLATGLCLSLQHLKPPSGIKEEDKEGKGREGGTGREGNGRWGRRREENWNSETPL